MNTRQLIKRSGIELQSSGFTTYSEFVTLDQFQILCNNIREDEMNMTLANILDLFRMMAQNSLINPEQHYFWKMAINLIETEFGDEDE